MKNLSTAILILTVSSLMTSYLLVQRAYAVDFEAPVLSTLPTLDGAIQTSEWSDAGHYSSVAIDPSGTAEIWTKHDATDLYMAIQFTADSATPWVSLQLGTTGCMDNGADGVIFGDTNSNPASVYTDIGFTGVGGWGNGPVQDATQNGAGVMEVDPTTKVVEIEFKKPLNSGDSAGKDIIWTVGGTFDFVIAWDSNGGGSSGGSANHKSGPTARTILISPNAIPEFPGWTLIAVMLILIVPVIVLARKITQKPPVASRL